MLKIKIQKVSFAKRKAGALIFKTMNGKLSLLSEMFMEEIFMKQKAKALRFGGITFHLTHSNIKAV